MKGCTRVDGKGAVILDAASLEHTAVHDGIGTARINNIVSGCVDPAGAIEINKGTIFNSGCARIGYGAG